MVDSAVFIAAFIGVSIFCVVIVGLVVRILWKDLYDAVRGYALDDSKRKQLRG